jgi:hypothetical protein
VTTPSRAERICQLSVNAREAIELAEHAFQSKHKDSATGATVWQFADGSELFVDGDRYWPDSAAGTVRGRPDGDASLP